MNTIAIFLYTQVYVYMHGHTYVHTYIHTPQYKPHPDTSQALYTHFFTGFLTAFFCSSRCPLSASSLSTSTRSGCTMMKSANRNTTTCSLMPVVGLTDTWVCVCEEERGEGKRKKESKHTEDRAESDGRRGRRGGRG